MNILYLDHYAGSPYHGRSFRPYYLGIEWLKRNNKLFVVAASFSHLRYNQPRCKRENIDGIEYIWLSTSKYKNNGIKRFISIITYIYKIFLHLKEIINISNPDVIIISSVHMFDIYPALLMKKLIKKKVILVFELHDLWPLTLIELSGFSKYNPFIILLFINEKIVYKTIDKVVSILPYTLKYMYNFGIKSNQFCYIPNGIVIKEWQGPKSLLYRQQKIIDSLKQQNKFIIGYAGAFTKANALFPLLEVSSLCKIRGNSNIHFIFLGHGIEYENILDFIKKHSLNNVSLFDSISKELISEFLPQMDLLYAGFLDKEIYKYGTSPNKIFDYMMSGRPVLYATSVNSNIINDIHCGVVVQSNSLESIYEGIIKLENSSKETLDYMGIQGKNFVMQHYDYSNLAKKFEEFLLEE